MIDAFFNAYTYVFDNRRRKLPCDVNFFRGVLPPAGRGTGDGRDRNDRAPPRQPEKACDTRRTPAAAIPLLFVSRSMLRMRRCRAAASYSRMLRLSNRITS